jgi:hypothetical protein
VRFLQANERTHKGVRKNDDFLLSLGHGKEETPPDGHYVYCFLFLFFSSIRLLLHATAGTEKRINKSFFYIVIMIGINCCHTMINKLL